MTNTLANAMAELTEPVPFGLSILCAYNGVMTPCKLISRTLVCYDAPVSHTGAVLVEFSKLSQESDARRLVRHLRAIGFEKAVWGYNPEHPADHSDSGSGE